MRLAADQDLEDLKQLLTESTEHANQVGHIDRPEVFENEYFTPLIEARELYCFEARNSIVGVARLTEADSPPTLWEDTDFEYLYVGKLATGNLVRNTQFFPSVMLPEIADEAKQRDKIGIRLSCLADNQKLIDYYSRLGFSNIGLAEILSSFYKRQIFVARFEIQV